MDTNKKKKPTDEQSPIIDGDARPDLPVNDDEAKKNIGVKDTRREKRTTPNRVDHNSFEDFRDVKEE